MVITLKYRLFERPWAQFALHSADDPLVPLPRYNNVNFGNCDFFGVETIKYLTFLGTPNKTELLNKINSINLNTMFKGYTLFYSHFFFSCR